MGKILDSKIKVPNIVIQKDKDDESGTEQILNEWGKSIPIIQIGDGDSSFILNPGDLSSFELNITFNSLPTFHMSINDESYQIRSALKNDIDKCIIFIGYKNWYIKFNGLIENNTSGVGDKMIDLHGIYYNPKLYEQQQKSFIDLPVTDILKQLCIDTDLGLYTIDNNELSKTVSYICTDKRNIDLIQDLIETKTTNIYCFDAFGFLHIGNIDNIRKEPISKYTLTPLTGKIIEASDIILTSDRRKLRVDNMVEETYDSEKNDTKIPIKYYTLNSNFSELLTKSYDEYCVKFSDKTQISLKDKQKVLVGNKIDNTFHGFKNVNFPFYDDVINKILNGNLITTEIEHLLFELTPFDIVDFECYLHQAGDKPFRKDEEHSGKKMVLGFSINYNYKSGELNKMSQTIHLI